MRESLSWGQPLKRVSIQDPQHKVHKQPVLAKSVTLLTGQKLGQHLNALSLL